MGGQDMDPIKFPGLGLEFIVDPVAFSVFGWPVHWYGIIISTGFLLAMLFVLKEAERVGVNPEIMIDVALFGTPAAIVGARLYYVAFQWQQYKDNPASIIAIWEGGLAIYGAIIAALISTVIYCKIKKINIWRIFDIGCMGLLIGQSIGRWGNFVNREAFGRETNFLWRMNIYVSEAEKRMDVHPTFLYESLWNAIGFLILFFYRKRKRYDGEIFLLYAFWYGLGRFWVEGLRTDSLMLGPLRISQIVALISMLVCVVLWVYFRKKKAKA